MRKDNVLYSFIFYWSEIPDIGIPAISLVNLTDDNILFYIC